MWRPLIILLAGSALGLGSAALAVWNIGGAGAVHVGPWITPLDAGGAGRGAYLRATAALRATLALSRQEAIYFRAATDRHGEPLRGGCRYTVRGADLPSRWWSITLYGADHYLIANKENRYAYASVNVAHDADGGFTLHVGPTAEAGNWLDTAGTAHIVLLTRLYQPNPAAAGAPANIKMPTIDFAGCG
jgi:hypothetical protein